MNIAEAKEQIKNSIRIYLKKNQFGDYRIPLVHQRPVFLLGPPGIGKTAIMEQIAQELNIALVAYSMTHHTRQSALGLPFIEHKTYAGQEMVISEYTMSEIIASIYETMERSGLQEGILFLDEINCVSETLSPTMLQFLQYKIFGRHRVPDGWIIVTAGNPPEYNKSVREFDIATMDRLRILEVQADYKVWRQYASSKGIHGAILSYLDLKKRDFYGVEASVQGKVYVTARGWEDLSEAMYLYEEERIPVDEAVISQYLHNEKVVSQFAAYYSLYNKYKKDYQILSILEGQAGAEIKEQARQARFDERTALLGLLLEVLQGRIRQNLQEEDFLRVLQGILKEVKAQLSTGKVLGQILDEELERQIEQRQALETANALSMEQKLQFRHIEAFLAVRPADFAEFKTAFAARVAELKADTGKIQAQLHNLFAFMEEVFGAGQEMLLLVTELTVNYYSVKFISSKGSEDYYHYNQELLFQERNQDIGRRMERLAADGALLFEPD